MLAVVALSLSWTALAPDPVRGDSVPPKKEQQEKKQQEEQQQEEEERPQRSPDEAVKIGIDWLASVQGENGGWGQDGGETSFVRQGENLESGGNDVANTAVATLALVRAGHTATQGKHQEKVRRALEFILQRVEASPEEGLAVTSVTGTQIQRKLGPHIDTFLTSMLFSEIDGETGDAETDRRVRLAREKCVAKIENNQQGDGSWNISGGWAPILGTSMASRSLFEAKEKGVDVNEEVLAKVDDYTKRSAQPEPTAGLAGSPGLAGGRAVSARVRAADAASAGVPLYKSAQVLEQLSRTEADREANAQEIAAVTDELSNAGFVRGFGSMGGEEFFSYLNISDSLRRTGGKEWAEWNGDIKARLVRLQNPDGTWAGHHCITGRVAVTSAAVLTILVDKEPVGPSAPGPTDG
jgi:hypothetical protein